MHCVFIVHGSIFTVRGINFGQGVQSYTHIIMYSTHYVKHTYMYLAAYQNHLEINGLCTCTHLGMRLMYIYRGLWEEEEVMGEK